MMSTAIPSISVVTATRGRPGNLLELVPIVLADETVRHLVIVVDGEDPESIAVLSSLQADYDRLIIEQVAPCGQLHALAAGVTLTDAEVVLLLDDDVIPTPGMIAGHARGHVNEQGLVLVGTMPVQLPPNRADIGSLLYARDYLTHCARIEIGEHEVLEWLWLGNVSIRRTDCLSVGLYSERFTASYHADQDLGFRLAEAGLTGRYDPSLVAAHRHRRNKRAFLNDARRRGAGLVQLHAVHPHMGPFDPADLTEGLPAAVAIAVRAIGSTPVAPFVARALLEMGSGLGVLGWMTGRNNLAKLSRRLMFLWGATAGEGPVKPAAPHVVLIVADYFPSLGGTTTQTRLHAREFARRGWEVTVLTRRIATARSLELIEGIPVRRISVAGRGRLAKMLYLASSWVWLRRRHRRISAVSVIMDADFAVVACLAGLRTKTALTWVTRGDATTRFTRPGGRFRLRILQGCAQVVLTPLIEHELAQFTESGTHLIPVPVDTTRFRQPERSERLEARSALGIDAQQVILFVGHLQERKAVDRLIGAVRILIDKGFGVVLLAVGGPVEDCDGQYVKSLETYIEAHSLTRNVRLCGPHDDVLPFLFAADIFCLPSHREGMPNVLLEAMACGLPCVAPASAGGDELLLDGAGIIPTSNTPEDLADAIGHLLMDPETQEKVRRLAIERVRRFNRIEEIVDDYERLFLVALKDDATDAWRRSRTSGNGYSVAHDRLADSVRA